MRIRWVRRGILLRLVHGLVGNDQCLEVVAGVGDGLDELRSKDSVGDLGALAHDGDPEGELRVVFARGEREIVAVLAETLHEVLVHHGENETIEGAVGHLLSDTFGDGRSDLGLLAVENVGGGFHALDRGRHALEEQRDGELAKAHQRVEALRQGQLHVDKGHVGATGSVRGKLIGLLLAEQGLRVGGILLGLLGGLREPHGAHIVGTSLGAHIADLCELVLQDRRMRLDPVVCLAAVAARAPEMYGDDEEDEGQDVELHLEVVDRSALPHAIPRRVRALANGRGGRGRCSARGGSERQRGRRFWCTCIVGEVYRRG
jgi:hypothetical protein